MERMENGVWRVSLPSSSLPRGTLYKFAVEQTDGEIVYRSDPYATCVEPSPGTAAVLLGEDAPVGRPTGWQALRNHAYKGRKKLSRPIHIYEVDLATWRQDDRGKPLSYRDLGFELIPYVKQMGYTHVLLSVIREGHLLSPVTEQGDPQALRDLFASFHEAGIGILLSVPLATLPYTEDGLARFDGTPLYEYADPTQAKSADGAHLRFDPASPASRHLILSALSHWVKVYGVDGFFFPNLPSILYRDYGRQGEGNTTDTRSTEAVAFFQDLNRSLKEVNPSLITVAEETTAWPQVTDERGLGFSFKLNLGWQEETAAFASLSPTCRGGHLGKLTYPMTYALSESHILPLSTLLRGTWLARLQGVRRQRLRMARLFSVMHLTLPGKKQTPMGWEIGQVDAWNPKKETNWSLTAETDTAVYQLFEARKNHFYLTHPALWEDEDAFEVIAPLSDTPILAYRRGSGADRLLILVNPLPTSSGDVTLPVPRDGVYRELLRTDQSVFGGDCSSLASHRSHRLTQNGHRFTYITLSIPPETAIILGFAPRT